MAIADLSDRRSLRLAITDLSNRRSLNLAIADLGNGGDPDLAITDLSDWRSLWLAIADLADRGTTAARGRMALNLSVSNLADGDGNSSSVDLRLAIGYGCDNGGLDDLCADSDLSPAASAASIAFVISASSSAATTARQYKDLDLVTLRCPAAVVQVEEATGEALIEDG